MIKKIETLTPEQEAGVIPFRDEWLRVGLSTERVDRDRATMAVKALYAASGESEPVVMHFDSPTQCIMAINFFRHFKCGADEGDNLGANLGANLGDNLGDNLWDNLRANLWDNLRANLWDNLRDNLGANLGAQKIDFVDTWFWGGQDSPWLAFYEYGRKIGVSYDKSGHLDAYIEYAKSCGWMYAYKGIAFVSDRPVCIHKDEQNRLHSETGKAVGFIDGTGVSAWHGVNIPNHWVTEKATIDPSEIIRHENVEVRAAGAALLGWPRMLSVLKERVIDDSGSTDIGQLIELTLPGLDRPGRFLKAVCPRNGIICEGVPYVSDIDGLPIETALHAQAWRIGDPLSDYQHPLVRT